MATWTLGTECLCTELAGKLASCQHDVIVIQFTGAVRPGVHGHYLWMEDMASRERARQEIRMHGSTSSSLRSSLRHKGTQDTIRRDKALELFSVHRWHTGHGETCGFHSCDSFLLLRRGKVSQAFHWRGFIRSRGQGDHGICFGMARITLDQGLSGSMQGGLLDTTDPKLRDVTLGLLDIRDAMDSDDVDALAAWIILERVDLVTGYFGGADELPLLSADARSPRTPLRELEHRSHTASSLKHAASLQELARRSHAVTSTPMYRPFYASTSRHTR